MTELIYRPGLEGIVAGETAISTIEGGLRYRGYSIEELAEHATFEEVAWLILHGELPRAAELAEFRTRLVQQMQLPGPLVDTIRMIPAAAPMMDVMRSGASLLAHWDPDAGDNGRQANLRKAERLLAQLPVVMATRHRLLLGQPALEPEPTSSLAENILWLVTGRRPTAKQARAMDISLILYAEHELNASTFTARVVCSTLSDLHSSVTAAIGALKGPLHGGANEKVMEVLQEVASPERAEQWVRDALARKQRIMGFGHRVYKQGDPRARYLKRWCAELAGEASNTQLEEIAEIIEQVVAREKGLPPNLDWPSARLYYYLGLPVDLYTPLFVCSRVVGWCAHVIEQLENNRLIRPRANYTGPPPRSWVPLEKR